MAVVALGNSVIDRLTLGLRNWANRVVARPGFQRWASRFPVARRIARKDGAALFDLVAGFVQSQALFALVELDVLQTLLDGPQSVELLADKADIPCDRMALLLQAGAAMSLLRRLRDGRFSLAQKGAALLGVPGLQQMILHHNVLYRDLSDPVAVLRGETQTQLSEFWPYVFGQRGDVDSTVTETYSDLMAQSQGLVAQDTLAAISLNGVTRLMDVGGGFGAFGQAVVTAYPAMQVDLFDLPSVTATAQHRVAQMGLQNRIHVHGGSFRDDPLPEGADAISLIRVLYDHRDETVRALLAKVYAALPTGGRLIVSEPMSGGQKPERAGDVYFAFYTMAMGTGTVRSSARIAELCAEAGFENIRQHRSQRPFVTSVLSAVRLG